MNTENNCGECVWHWTALHCDDHWRFKKKFKVVKNMRWWWGFTKYSMHQLWDQRYSYLLILTQCRNCNKDKWQKKYEGDVREGTSFSFKELNTFKLWPWRLCSWALCYLTIKSSSRTAKAVYRKWTVVQHVELCI